MCLLACMCHAAHAQPRTGTCNMIGSLILSIRTPALDKTLLRGGFKAREHRRADHWQLSGIKSTSGVRQSIMAEQAVLAKQYRFILVSDLDWTMVSLTISASSGSHDRLIFGGLKCTLAWLSAIERSMAAGAIDHK